MGRSGLVVGGRGQWWLVVLAGLLAAAPTARAAEEVPLGAQAAAEEPPGKVLERVQSESAHGRPRSADVIRLNQLFLDRPLDAADLMLQRAKAPAPTMDYLLARIHDAKGNRRQALHHYRRALAASPAGAPITAELAARVAELGGLLLEEQRRPVRCPEDRAALYALEDERGKVHYDRRPLLLVHGYNGTPLDLYRIVDRLRKTDEQVFVACYESRRRSVRENAEQIAAMIRALGRAHRPALGAGLDGAPPAAPELVVVAHSLGGLVTRLALNVLALSPGRPLEAWGGVRFVAVDSPWHGFTGPPDDAGAANAFWLAISPLFPKGISQMRARSVLFRGDARSADPVTRAGLFGVELPANVSVHLAFAEEGADVLSYRKGVLHDLPARLVGWFCHDHPVDADSHSPHPRHGAEAALDDDPRIHNFWRALQSSSDYPPFAAAMRGLAEQGRLDEPAALRLLEAHFPVFPGNHGSILDEQPGRPSFLDHLIATLQDRPRRPS